MDKLRLTANRSSLQISLLLLVRRQASDTFLYAVDMVHIDVPAANLRRHHVVAGDLCRLNFPVRPPSTVLIHVADRHCTDIISGSSLIKNKTGTQ